ncbi:unnamed protein product, partial [Staurois parvus]
MKAGHWLKKMKADCQLKKKLQASSQYNHSKSSNISVYCWSMLDIYVTAENMGII